MQESNMAGGNDLRLENIIQMLNSIKKDGAINLAASALGGIATVYNIGNLLGGVSLPTIEDICRKIKNTYSVRYKKFLNPFDSRKSFDMDSHYIPLNLSLKSKNDDDDDVDRKILSDKKLNDFLRQDRAKVLVNAMAGTGKSTYCTSLIYQWSKEKKFEDFELIFIIRLRDFKEVYDRCLFVKMVNQLAGLQLSEVELAVLAVDIEARCDKVLFILDGLDELYQDFRFNDTGNWNKLMQYRCIITSRAGHENAIGDCLSTRLMGMDQAQMSTYIDNYFNQKVKEANDLKAFIASGIIADDFLTNPLLLNIICQLWVTNEEKRKLFQGITLTNLLNTITADKIGFAVGYEIRCKTIIAEGKLDSSKQKTWSEIEYLLEITAYEAYISDTNIIETDLRQRVWQKYGLSNRDGELDRFLLMSGLFLSWEDDRVIQEQTFDIIHRIFIEYYAARYWVSQVLKGGQEFNKPEVIEKLFPRNKQNIPLFREVLWRSKAYISEPFQSFAIGLLYPKNTALVHRLFKSFEYIADENSLAEILSDKNFSVLKQDTELTRYKNNSDNPLTHLTAKYGRVKAFEALLNLGFSMKERDMKGSEPIMTAAEFGEKEVIDFILSKINDKSEKQEVAVRAFKRTTFIPIFELLHPFLEGIGTLKEVKEVWYQALYYSSIYEKLEVVKYLLEKMPSELKAGVAANVLYSVRKIAIWQELYATCASILVAENWCWELIKFSPIFNIKNLSVILEKIPNNIKSKVIAAVFIQIGNKDTLEKLYLLCAKELKSELKFDDWQKMLFNISNNFPESLSFILDKIPDEIKIQVVVDVFIKISNKQVLEKFYSLFQNSLTRENWQELLKQIIANRNLQGLDILIGAMPQDLKKQVVEMFIGQYCKDQRNVTLNKQALSERDWQTILTGILGKTCFNLLDCLLNELPSAISSRIGAKIFINCRDQEELNTLYPLYYMELKKENWQEKLIEIISENGTPEALSFLLNKLPGEFSNSLSSENWISIISKALNVKKHNVSRVLFDHLNGEIMKIVSIGLFKNIDDQIFLKKVYLICKNELKIEDWEQALYTAVYYWQENAVSFLLEEMPTSHRKILVEKVLSSKEITFSNEIKGMLISVTNESPLPVSVAVTPMAATIVGYSQSGNHNKVTHSFDIRDCKI